MAEKKQNFAEIILPLAAPGTFTYKITDKNLNKIKVGQRVAVPFGSNKLYTGIVHSIHQNEPELFKAKKIEEILDNYALVTPTQIKFWEWIADYYMCSLGEVYRNAFPGGLKWESETFVELTGLIPDFYEEFSTDEILLKETLEKKGKLKFKEIYSLFPEKYPMKIIKSLWEKGIIRLEEVIKEKYTPKKELFIRVVPKIKSDQTLFQEAMEKMKNAQKQRELFLQLIVLEKQSAKPVKVSRFLKAYSGSHGTLRSMEDKGVVEISEEVISRITEKKIDIKSTETLTKEQEFALNKIEQFFFEQKHVLLHGVASAGKTEVYIKLIEKTIISGKRVLFLMPDIALTSQMVQRIQKHFGKKVGIYHSKFNENERVELWKKTLNGDYQIVLGVRSALFLPIQEIGLIIVDEEHDPAYKQNHIKPYFHAGDMAMVLAGMQKAKVLLGSATPSLESYHNAQTGKLGYVELTQRYSPSELPVIELVDLRKALNTKEITEDITNILREAIEENIREGKQILIFQNRRGFAPVMECLDCGFTPFCPNCDVPLTFHKYSNSLRCHYCGHQQAKLSKCPNCQGMNLTTRGIGTQQIEIQLEKLFPKLTIRRMDIDSMRKKYAYEKILEAFEFREIDILIGTRMIAKGLDFSNVGLIGVIRADTLLNFPDFRAHERAFQLLTQLAGRAGRREEQGKVLIQTYNPNHEILQDVSRYDYKKMVKEALYERKSFLYPPFLRLIHITFRHQKRERTEKTAEQFVKLLRPYLDDKHLLGPEEPAVARIKNKYIRNVLIKIPPDASLKKVKDLIRKSIESLHTVSVFRTVRIDIDVDP